MKRIGTAVLAAAAVWAGFYPTHAQSARVNGAPGDSVKRPMTFADLMAMKRVSDPQISPSGRWVLFSVTDVDLAQNTKTNHLWVVPIDGSAPEHEVTTGAGESFGRFAPDGRQVSWTQNPGSGESFARTAIAAWDEKSGTVSGAQPLTGISGDADGAVWSPDSRRLMFTTEVWPECSVKTNTGVLRSAQDDGEKQATTKANAGPSTSHLADAARSGRDDDSIGGIEIGGTRDGSAWKGMEPAAWADEDACDKAKNAAADANPVKAQVWDGLLYRHWDHWTGAKRTHILIAELAQEPLPISERAGGGMSEGSIAWGWRIRDVTTARDVGDAETPTWMLGGPQEYAWAPDSKEIAYVSDLSAVPAASTNNDVFTLRVDEPDAKPVKVSTSAGSDDEPEYSPDGKYLAFRSQRQAGFESDRERLTVYDRERKAAQDLMPKFDGWVDEFTWAGSSAIDLVAGYHGEEDILAVSIPSNAPIPPEIKAVLDLDKKFGAPGPGYPALLAGGAEFSNILPGIEKQVPGIINLAPAFIVAVSMKVNSPAEIVKIHLCDCGVDSLPNEIGVAGSNSSSVVALTHVNGPLMQQLYLDPLEPFWFTGAEETKVEGFLLKPPNFDPSKKYPLKFIMHGGPQTMAGDNWSYRWNWELMAASGYVVVGINRRGSTGYGQKLVDEVSGDWGGRAYEDLMKGLDYAEANYQFIDKTRECALGASYGGFMADWVLTHTNRFQCIVTHDGLYDAAAAYGSTEEMWFPEWEFRRPKDFPKGWDGFSGYNPMGHRNPTHDDRTVVNGPPGDGNGHAAEPWRYAGLPANQDPFRRWSPKEYIQNAKTPTLIIHSQKDYRLDISQDFELYTALQRLGVPSRFLYFPDEGHWVLKPKNAELWNAVVSDWCDRWTHSGKYADTK